MTIQIPELAVVALIGVSGSGKTTFANKHFKPTEVLSSDYFRALVSDDENNQTVTSHAFDALYYIADKRLELGLLTVIDATNVQKEARAEVLKQAKEQNCHAVAIVLDISEKVCRDRNEKRPDRDFPHHVIASQSSQLRRSIKYLKKEGFSHVYILKTDEDIANAQIIREKLWNNKKDETGPFDIIGDIHGCYDELCELFEKLGYIVDKENYSITSPEGRKAIFLGDLCDRGPKSIEVLRLVMNMVSDGTAYCVAGNHDTKFQRKLAQGGNLKDNFNLPHGLGMTFEQLRFHPLTNERGEDFFSEIIDFIYSLKSHYVFDDGNLVVAHAGLKEKYQGRGSRRVRDFCLYGDTTGETDEYGLPVRLPWANEYRGRAMVVYGHTPAPEVAIVNNTYCIDTGCVFGGKLTALRYPEKEIVQVNAAQEYYAPVKPLHDKPFEDDDVLSITDVISTTSGTGQKYLTTRLRQTIKIREENSIAALEVMSRFAADPHWLIYLPPTMSPCETSSLDTYLEYPTEAFEYYKTRGVGTVVCQEKHMGSRAIIVLCKDLETAKRRFKVNDNRFGIIYTRTGRHFFDNHETEETILNRLQAELTASGFWDDFETDWVCLDTELMPWSAKAQKLLSDQYAPVGCSGRNGLAASIDAISKAVERLGVPDSQPEVESRPSVDLSVILEQSKSRLDAITKYTDAYRRYCWSIKSPDDYRIAPFHILATEGKAHIDKSNMWHMETIKKYMTGTDPIFMATKHKVVDLLDENSVTDATKWWEDLTISGGEGMVVKPNDFITFKGTELLQPAVKCRGRVLMT